MTLRMLVATLTLDVGVLWLVGALLDPDADPVSGAAEILWLVGLAVLVLVAALVGHLLTADSATPFRVLAMVLAAALVATLVLVPADGLAVSARTMLVESVVLLALAAVVLVWAVRTRRRPLV